MLNLWIIQKKLTTDLRDGYFFLFTRCMKLLEEFQIIERVPYWPSSGTVLTGLAGAGGATSLSSADGGGSVAWSASIIAPLQLHEQKSFICLNYWPIHTLWSTEPWRQLQNFSFWLELHFVLQMSKFVRQPTSVMTEMMQSNWDLILPWQNDKSDV